MLKIGSTGDSLARNAEWRKQFSNETTRRTENEADEPSLLLEKEVLFVWNYTEWGGAQIYFLGIMRLLREMNIRVCAVMPEGTSEKLLGYFERENIPTSFFPTRIDAQKAANFGHKIRRRLNDLRCHWILARHLSELNLENKIVHLDVAPWNAASLLYFLARKAEVFVTLHISQSDAPTLRNRWIRLKYKLLCRLPKFHLLASNEDMRQSLRWFVDEKFFASIPIAYTGVNTREIRGVLNLPLEREKLIQKYGLSENRLLVFSLGSLIERKGFRVLLEAARRLKNENLFFVWIGDGEKLAEMQQLIVEFRLENSVKVIRPTEIGENREDLLRLFRIADIFVHPSFAEGLPGAMLEAMALGLPVVVSEINAVPEAVKNMENGLLVRAGDADEFAKAILTLAKDGKLRENLANKGQETVLNNFTEERCAEVTIDFYKNCLNTF
ncbi:MAG: glycosyltransferase family 4 protein [Acidobacteriota bacterium]|nr:glycosyltransferase family 4 protein [Acidobacteriota bacterium]